MIEGSPAPSGCAVTGVARKWKAGLNVIGIRCPVVIGDVTCLTSRILQRVIVIDVAGLTWHGNVCARQGKSGGRMIERSAAPTRGCMAGKARRWEPGGDMARIVRIGVIRFVATVAVRRQSCVVVVDMATRARHAYVRSGERKRGLSVIERGRLPSCGVVAHRAGRGEAALVVIWICCPVEVFDVAGRAIRWGSGKFSSDVA